MTGDWCRAFDYLHNINLPLDNFISRSNDKFLSNPEHCKLVYDVIHKAMSHEDASDRDCVEGCKLTESLGQSGPCSAALPVPRPAPSSPCPVVRRRMPVWRTDADLSCAYPHVSRTAPTPLAMLACAAAAVLNCPGALDPYIPELLKLVSGRLQAADARVAQQGQPMRAYCRTELMKMAAICLYYNPQGTLLSMEQTGCTQQIFQASASSPARPSCVCGMASRGECALASLWRACGGLLRHSSRVPRGEMGEGTVECRGAGERVRAEVEGTVEGGGGWMRGS
jgi:hypothetical protein